MKSKTERKLRKLDKEAQEAKRKSFYDKDKDKASLEKTMADIADVAKTEGIE